MFIGVNHQISDPKKFWDTAKEELPKVPAGFNLCTAVASKEGATAFCLWEAESVEKLKAYMEPRWGGPVAVNKYFEIDAEKAVGLPTPVVK